MPAVRLRFPLLGLLALTGLDLGLIALSTLGLQDGRPWLIVLSLMLLALSSSALLLLCREWFSPSYIEFDKEMVSIKWNNWRLAGRRLKTELSSSRPRTLELEVGDPAFHLDPVGPLHLASMLLVKPMLSAILPPYLANIYYLDSKKLKAATCSHDGTAQLRFPIILLGKRRIRNAIEKSLG